MEDQGEQSPQTFLVKYFSNLQINLNENMTIGALPSEFWILITDLKQLPVLMKTKMVMYIIASKLNYTFGTIGNATADKLTAKVVDKLEPFALAWRIINLKTRSCSEACEMFNLFLRLNTFLRLNLNENLLLLGFLSHFF